MADKRDVLFEFTLSNGVKVSNVRQDGALLFDDQVAINDVIVDAEELRNVLAAINSLTNPFRNFLKERP